MIYVEIPKMINDTTVKYAFVVITTLFVIFMIYTGRKLPPIDE
jgi:hypothetical protein